MASKALSAAALQSLHQRIAEFPIKRRWLPLHRPATSLSTSPTASSTCLTIVSYNLLAQCLIRRRFYPSASKQALRVAHRTTQLTAELLSLSPDIIALQEVDVDLFHSHYQPVLGHFGYAGLLASKAHGRHGCAIFYKEEQLSAVSYSELQLDDIAADDEFAQDPDTQEELRKGNVAQLLALQLRSTAPDPSSSSPPPPSDHPLDDGGGRCGLLVSNTHSHWNPAFRFVRLKQCERLLSTVHRTRLGLLPSRFHPVLCGDWNITPATSIYSFLTTATIDPSLWPSFAPPAPPPQRANEDDEAAPPADVPAAVVSTPKAADGVADEGEAVHRRMEQVRLVLARRFDWPLLCSAYSSYRDIVPHDIRQSVLDSAAKEWCGWTEGPPFTHYLDRYKGCLDYIFTVKGDDDGGGAENGEGGWKSTLEVVSVLELLTEERIAHAALPNDELGSDHLCIGARLVLTTQNTNNSTHSTAAASAAPAVQVEHSV